MPTPTKLSRRTLLVTIASGSLALPLLRPLPVEAQSPIPDGVFVRESTGALFLILGGQRISVPIWQAPDATIASVPLADRWAVLNDAGAIVAGDRPSWLALEPAPPAQPVTSGQLVTSQVATWQERTFGSTSVVGMIENQATADLAVKTIAVSLLAANGDTVGGAEAFGKPTVLKAGARAPWHALVTGLPAFADVRVQVESGPVDNRFSAEVVHSLRLDGVTAQPRRPAAQPRLVGQVVNTSTQATGQAHLIAAVFAPDGRLLDVGDAYSKLETLPPGQSSPFEISFISPAVQDVSRYQIYAEARVKS